MRATPSCDVSAADSDGDGYLGLAVGVPGGGAHRHWRTGLTTHAQPGRRPAGPTGEWANIISRVSLAPRWRGRTRMSQVEEVVSAWERLVRWLAGNTPAHADALNPPATQEQIARSESVMGLGLPAELRQLLRMNNGSTAKHRSLTSNTFYDARGGGDYSPFPSDLLFCDVELMCSLYTGNRKASLAMREPGSRYEYWKEGWIPVFRRKEAHCGLFLDVSRDLDPAPVYAYEEESFPEPAFPSLADYLSTVADALEGVRPFTVMGRQAPRLPTVREGLVRW